MELSKEQIQFIDHRLENEGIKYWDIRIEMLDHIVLDVEETLKPKNTEYEFKEIVQKSFVSLGWKENFNGGGFDKIFLNRLKIYAKNANTGILKEYKEKLLNLKVITIISSFLIYLFTFRNNAFILKFTMAFALLIFVIAFIKFTLNYKVFNSVRLNRTIIFASFPLSVFNVLMFFPQFFFGFEKLSSFYVSSIFGIITPFLVIGVNYLYKEFKSAQKTYDKLLN